MRLKVSVTTPGAGALPGWGTARGTGAIVARRMIPRATRASTFRVDFRIGPVAIEKQRLGWTPPALGVVIKARHVTCAACRAHIWSDSWQGSFAPRDISVSLTLRNRDDPAKLMPSGPVDVEVVFHGWAHSPQAVIGGNYVVPIMVLPPGVGRSAIRAELAVLSVRPL
jgi:hypothetical protein